MIEAKISFAQVDVAQIDVAKSAAAKRLPRLLGLGMAAIVSAGLWGALVLAATHIL